MATSPRMGYRLPAPPGAAAVARAATAAATTTAPLRLGLGWPKGASARESVGRCDGHDLKVMVGGVLGLMLFACLWVIAILLGLA